MKRTLIISVLLLTLLSTTARAQAIWDKEHLASVKENLRKDTYATAYRSLLREADGLLARQTAGATAKERRQESGRPEPAAMATAVTTLSLAWYFSTDERYAEKAVEMLRVWFVNKDTRMNPVTSHASAEPDTRVADACPLTGMLDGVQLLEGSTAFTKADQKALKGWFAQFLGAMLTSQQGIGYNRQNDSRATAHDLMVIACANYVGNKKVMDDYLRHFRERRVTSQIEPDGRQPQELQRTQAFGCSQQNLARMIDVMQIARHAGYPTDGLDRIGQAARFLMPYLGKDAGDWPFGQDGEWEHRQDELAKDIYRLALLDPQNDTYMTQARQHLVKRFTEPFFLLYYTPDDTDDAFARADTQLRHLLQQTENSRREKKDWSLMPRSVGKDGSLRTVRQPDWCCGFFAGELWSTRTTPSGASRQQATRGP